MNWIRHILTIQDKIIPLFGALIKRNCYFDNTMKMIIYYSLIEKHLMYYIAVWSNASKTTIQRVQRLENRRLKTLNWRIVASEVFSGLGLIEVLGTMNFELLMNQKRQMKI